MTHRKMLGQFFTPKIIVDFMYNLSGISPLNKVIDPSCGEGIFIIGALESGCGTIVGIDINEKTIEDCRTNLEQYKGRYHLFCQDGLKEIETDNGFWKGYYDLVIGNPPFNSSN